MHDTGDLGNSHTSKRTFPAFSHHRNDYLAKPPKIKQVCFFLAICTNEDLEINSQQERKRDQEFSQDFFCVFPWNGLTPQGLLLYPSQMQVDLDSLFFFFSLNNPSEA